MAKPKLNDGHWTELIHTAHLAQEFFNRNVRDHVLGVHLEATDEIIRNRLEEASRALYAAYNAIALTAPDTREWLDGRQRFPPEAPVCVSSNPSNSASESSTRQVGQSNGLSNPLPPNILEKT